MHSMPILFHVHLKSINGEDIKLSLSKNLKRSISSSSLMQFNMFSDPSHFLQNSITHKFAYTWNQIIESLRSEDLLSNRYSLSLYQSVKYTETDDIELAVIPYFREMDLMTMHIGIEISKNMVCWPVFLIANKVTT